MLQAQAAPVEEYMQYLPDGANLALMVQKVGASTPIIDYHGKQMALPASTMKVITALAALLELGPDFRFQTTLETRGAITDGTLNGDLVARFGGDPTLSRQNLRNMVAALKQQGITHIKGNLVIDTSVFASHDMARRLSTKTVSRFRFTVAKPLVKPPLCVLRLTIRPICSARSGRLPLTAAKVSTASWMWCLVSLTAIR